MHGFPVVGRYHFNRVPGTAIKESAIRSFADAFLAADTEIGIDFDAAERRMILVGYPEHARLDGTVLYACRRACAPGAAVSRDRKYAWLLLTRSFAVANRHGPMLFYDVVHANQFRVLSFKLQSTKQEIGAQFILASDS